MIKLYAQPYDISANGLYFDSVEEYEKLNKINRNECRQAVEEYQIQFID